MAYTDSYAAPTVPTGPSTSTGLKPSNDDPLNPTYDPQSYNPDERTRRIISEVERKYKEYRQDRQQHEPQWFINAAMFRGNHSVAWSSIDNRLSAGIALNPNRQRRQINRIFAKVRARRAKFLKNRPTWVIVPATTDIKDKLDARATGKVLDYIWRKLHLEQKYIEAVMWSETCGRSFWWFCWDENAIGRISLTDPLTGQPTIQPGVVGEVVVETGSPFEVLVDNPGAMSMRNVNELIRAKERPLDYVRKRFPQAAPFVAAESPTDAFLYETQIASLNTTGGIFGTSDFSSARTRDQRGQPTTVVVKEYFRRPTDDLPNGKYCVVANGVLLKEQDELPYGFADMENPFPCVEFTDVATPGQYWGTTVIEQMIDLQREYNAIRNMISTQIKIMGHPKVFVAKQHQLAEGAWTPDAGEIIEYNARPGIPEPKPWIPPNIVADAWRAVDLIKKEFDDVTQIFPVSEGGSGGTQSGFQANILQESSEMVHGPDIRQHELAIEEAAFKIRRIVKQGYDVPRLITVTSASYEPEVLEFCADDVDENADIIVQAGSALPQLKGARINAALDLYQRGVMGDPNDPQVRRRLLNVLDLGGMDDIYEYNRLDDDMINIENAAAEDGKPIAQPRFFEDHQQHWTGHINRLKSPAVLNWAPERRMGLLAHAILHAMFMNHAAAYQMAIEAGMPGLVPPPPPMPMGGQAMPGAPGQPPPDAAGPAGPAGPPAHAQPPPHAGAPAPSPHPQPPAGPSASSVSAPAGPPTPSTS